MKNHIFYYLRNPVDLKQIPPKNIKKNFQMGPPQVTVVFGQVEGVWVRGVAICSYSEFPSKKTGRKCAMRYFNRAAGIKKDDFIITRDRAKKVCKNVFYAPGNQNSIFPLTQHKFFGCHSHYDTKPTALETRLWNQVFPNIEELIGD